MRVKSLMYSVLLLCVLGGAVSDGFAVEQDDEYSMVKVIYRPLSGEEQVKARDAQKFRHAAIVSDILPYGIWEMGPGPDGMIETTNTVKDLSKWKTHIITQKIIEDGSKDIVSQSVEVKKKGLLDAIKLYEKTLAEKHKYWVIRI